MPRIDQLLCWRPTFLMCRRIVYSECPLFFEIRRATASLLGFLFRVQIASKGKVLVDLRAFLEIGSRTVRTPAGLHFPIETLPKVIEALQRANAQIKTWEIGDD